MDDLRQEMESNPPLPGAYVPRKGDVCAARFSQDDQWYRARLEKIEGSTATVCFIDYGNVSCFDVWLIVAPYDRLKCLL